MLEGEGGGAVTGTLGGGPPQGSSAGRLHPAAMTTCTVTSAA